jgi:hypothetical protein
VLVTVPTLMDGGRCQKTAYDSCQQEIPLLLSGCFRSGETTTLGEVTLLYEEFEAIDAHV